MNERQEQMIFDEGRRRGREEALNSLKTKLVRYYDEDENVWKIGAVIIDETD